MVYYCLDSEFGFYWFIIKFNDIVVVDSDYICFFFENNIVIGD